MKCKGRVWKFGSDINTDVILPGQYLSLHTPEELAEHCMENANPEFVEKAKTGDIIVAETNFGCGSSREHAPIAIKGKGISCVIAESFARIFYRNAFNTGLPILESAEAAKAIRDGNEVEVDLVTGEIQNLTTKETYKAIPIPEFMREIIDDGGLLEHIAKRRV